MVLVILALLERVTTDVVVLDLHMLGWDGFEVLRHIRAQKLPVRVLVLTALVVAYLCNRHLN